MQDFPQGNLHSSEQGSVNTRTTVNDINIKPTLNLFKSPRVLDHPGKQIFRDLHFKVASLDLDSLPELPGVITTPTVISSGTQYINIILPLVYGSTQTIVPTKKQKRKKEKQKHFSQRFNL